MTAFKELGKISIVTDTETGQERIGDAAGGFDDFKLKEHIREYGTENLLKTMAWMNFQIWQTYRELNAEKDREMQNSVNTSK